MEGGADVRSIEAIREFRISLIKFIEEGRVALASADSEVSRALTWIERDRLPHWKKQVRIRGEDVTRAKSVLTRAKDGTSYRRKSYVDEEKALQRAERRLEAAQRHHEACRRWLVRLEKESLQYRGRTQQLGTLLDADLSSAVHLLERTAQKLEKYVSLQAPTLDPDAPKGGSGVSPREEDSAGGSRA